MDSFGSAVSTRKLMRECQLYRPRPAQLPSRSKMSTTEPFATFVAGFSIIFWNIHGCQLRRAVLRFTRGNVSVIMALF